MRLAMGRLGETRDPLASNGMKKMSGEISNRAAYRRRPSNWLIAFCVLTALSVVTIGISLFLNQKIIGIYEVTAKQSQEMLAIESELLDLSHTALKVNGPGILGVIDDKKIKGEKADYKSAYEHFKRRLHALEAKIEAADDDALSDAVLFHITAAQGSLFQLNWEVKELFVASSAGDIDQAVLHFSLMETYYSDLMVELGRAVKEGRGVVTAIIGEQLEFVQQLRVYMWILASSAFILFTGALCFGLRERFRVRNADGRRLVERRRGREEPQRLTARPGLAELGKRCSAMGARQVSAA